VGCIAILTALEHAQACSERLFETDGSKDSCNSWSAFYKDRSDTALAITTNIHSSWPDSVNIKEEQTTI